MNNAMANIHAGNINYNNAAAVGMTVPQAQAYYNNLVAQQQAQAQAEAERQAWERQQQEIANAQKWASINNDIRNTDSLIESRKNQGSNDVIKQIEEELKTATTAEQAMQIIATKNLDPVTEYNLLLKEGLIEG